MSCLGEVGRRKSEFSCRESRPSELENEKLIFLAGNLAKARQISPRQDLKKEIPQRQPNPYMPLDHFEAYVFWPRDMFYYSGGRSNK